MVWGGKEEKEEDSLIRPGVLNKNQIKKLGEKQWIKNLKKIGFSSFDLHLSFKGWEIKGSVKCLQNKDCLNVIKQRKFFGRDIDLNKKCILQKGKTYVFLLEESMNLPLDEEYHCIATGRSSLGRLGILVRLIVNKSSEYDKIPKGYQGELFVEVTPLTFDIKVKKGVPIAQLRVFRGKPELSELTEEAIGLYKGIILDNKGKEITDSKKMCNLTVNLDSVSMGNQKVSAFMAKKNCPPIDLTKGKGSHDPKKFWKPLSSKGGFIEIKPGEFYILRSKERFKLPEDIAVHAQAVTETLGELRIHYAGFIHPNFGSSNKDRKGTPIIFEVSGYNVKTFLRDGEVLAKMKFYRMSEPYKLMNEEEREEEKGYKRQELKLSNYFRDWNSSL